MQPGAAPACSRHSHSHQQNSHQQKPSATSQHWNAADPAARACPPCPPPRRWGHAEPNAGLVALHHAATGAAHHQQPHLLHLRALNPHCAHILGGAAPGAGSGGRGLCAGRQQAPRPLAAAPLQPPPPAAQAGGSGRSRRGVRGTTSPAHPHQQHHDSTVLGTSSFAFMGTNAHVVSRVVHGPRHAPAPPASAAASVAAAAPTRRQHHWRRRHLWAAPCPSLLARWAAVGGGLGGARGSGAAGMVVMQAALGHPGLAVLWDHRVGGQVGQCGGRTVLGAAWQELCGRSSWCTRASKR